MSATRKKNGRFKVGDWVAFPYGTKDLFAQIVELRGPIGVNGRHLYRIAAATDFGEPDFFEMPGEEINAVAPPDKSAIVKYLTEGGLEDMLRSSLNGGRDQPKVWLSYTRRGKLAHTTNAWQGLVGGATLPRFTLHEGGVFKSNEDEIVRFITSFGLNRDEAQEILAASSTAP